MINLTAGNGVDGRPYKIASNENGVVIDVVDVESEEGVVEEIGAFSKDVNIGFILPYENACDSGDRVDVESEGFRGMEAEVINMREANLLIGSGWRK